MKTSLKVLIAGAVTAMAATFSTGASAASLLDLHEQHKAQALNFLFGGNQQDPITFSPAYQAAPAQAPVRSYRYRDQRDHGDQRWNGRRDDRRYDRDYRDGRGGYRR